MRKWISLALCLVLCLTYLPGDVISVLAMAEAVSQEEPSDDLLIENPEPAPAALGDGDPSELLLSEDEDEPSADAAVSTDDADPAAPGPWYARVTEEAVLSVDGDTSRIIPEGSVLLVTEDRDDGLLRIACASLSGLVDANALTRLSEAEVSDFMNALPAEGVVLYNDDLRYPLPAVEFAIMDENAQTEDGDDSDPQPDDEDQMANDGEGDPSAVDGAEVQPNAEGGDIQAENDDDSNMPDKDDADALTEPGESEAPEGENEDEALPGSIVINADTDTVVVGVHESIPLPTVEARDPDNNPVQGVEITWNSEDESIVRLDENGGLYGVKAGSTVVRACAEDYAEFALKVTVEGRPAQIVCGRESYILIKGMTRNLNAIVLDAAGDPVDNCTLDYSISQTSVNMECISVAPDGLVTALYAGSAEIEITCSNNPQITARVDVEVREEAATVAFTRASLSIGLKESLSIANLVRIVSPEGMALEPEDIVWRAGKKSIASISAEGLLKGEKLGSAAVYASVAGGPEAKLTVVVKKAPDKVTLNPKTLNISVDMTVKLNPQINRKTSACAHFLYSSSNTAVADVDKNGLVVGTGVGSATITVKTYNGKKKATCIVNVKPRAASVRIDPIEYLVSDGMTLPIRATALDGNENPTPANFSYQSEHPEIASVDARGVITGHARGETVIQVTALEDVSATCQVVVCARPADLLLNTSSLIIGSKEKYTRVTYELVPPEGENQCAANVTWKSSNKKVAKVTSSGVITGVKAGKATITVSAGNGLDRKISVIVRKAPKKVFVKPAKLRVSEGMTGKLAAAADKGAASGVYTFTGNDPEENYIHLDPDGTVLGKAEGTVTVTAKSYNGKSGKGTVVVLPPPVGMTLAQTEISIIAAQTARISPSVTDKNGNATVANYFYEIDHESEDPQCLTVDGTGLIRGLHKGTAKINVTTHNGVSAQCSVIVRAAPADITLSTERLTVGVKESYRNLTVTLNPPEGEETCEAVLSWRSENSKIAKVRETYVNGEKRGVITGVKAGKTKIHVRTHNGIDKAVEVTVKKAPTTVKLSPSSFKMSVGMDPVRLVPSFNKKAYSNGMTYSSGNSNVAVVDGEGNVTAVARGKATITGKSFNGKSGRATVQVYNEPAEVFITQALTLAEGMTLPVTASVKDSEGAESYTKYTFTPVDGKGSVTVDENGNVTGVREGEATIKISTHNGVSTHLVNGQPVETVCTVTVKGKPTSAEFDINNPDKSVTIYMYESYKPPVVIKNAKGEDLKDIVPYEFSTSGAKNIISVAKDGTITAKAQGTAFVTLKTYSAVSQCPLMVTVKRRFRAFIAYNYQYNKNKYIEHALHFPKNNSTGIQTLLKNSSINGDEYTIKAMLGNPTKSETLYGIANAFANGKDSDVNIIYLCSHGHKDPNYRMSLPGYKNNNSSPSLYMTAQEIYTKISAIKGRTILILDSCYSGVFIDNMKSKLKKNGRISVLTAASATRASYCNVTNAEPQNNLVACDFFTYYLLMGAGFNMKISGSNKFTGKLPADSNKDGSLTLKEMFKYANAKVTSVVPGYRYKSWFHGDKNQKPRAWYGSNANLVIYRPK